MFEYMTIQEAAENGVLRQGGYRYCASRKGFPVR